MFEFWITTLVVLVTIVVAYAIGQANGRRSIRVHIAPVSPTAASSVDRTPDEALLELLRKCSKLIWMMATEAGGKVTISAATEAACDVTMAAMVYGRDAVGKMTIEVAALTKT